jgi:hypothetical protein
MYNTMLVTTLMAHLALTKWSEFRCSDVLFDVSLAVYNITAPIGDNEDDVANDSVGNGDVSSFLIYLPTPIRQSQE